MAFVKAPEGLPISWDEYWAKVAARRAAPGYAPMPKKCSGERQNIGTPAERVIKIDGDKHSLIRVTPPQDPQYKTAWHDINHENTAEYFRRRGFTRVCYWCKKGDAEQTCEARIMHAGRWTSWSWCPELAVLTHPAAPGVTASEMKYWYTRRGRTEWHYCRRHNPQIQIERQAVRSAKYAAEQAEHVKKRRRQDEERELVRVAKEWRRLHFPTIQPAPCPAPCEHLDCELARAVDRVLKFS